jgi:hypothetical protein
MHHFFQFNVMSLSYEKFHIDKPKEIPNVENSQTQRSEYLQVKSNYYSLHPLTLTSRYELSFLPHQKRWTSEREEGVQ